MHIAFLPHDSPLDICYFHKQPVSVISAIFLQRPLAFLKHERNLAFHMAWVSSVVMCSFLNLRIIADIISLYFCCER